MGGRDPGIKTPFSVLSRTALFAFPTLLVPLLLVVGIAAGYATPTEISSVAVICRLLLSAVLYRELTWRKLRSAVSDTGVKAGMILLITATASTIAYNLTAAEKYDLELTIARDQEARDKLKAKLIVVNPDIDSFRSAINYDQIQLVNSDKGRDLIKRLLAIR